MAANSSNSDIRCYVVESGIPIPLVSKSSLYPFHTMKVGDSFAVQTAEMERIRASASYYGTRHPPMKFSVRIADPSTRTYRCWRIA